MSFKLDRSFYIPSAATFPDVVERSDPESSAVVYLYTGQHGQPVAKMFSGKRAKPDEFVRYPSPERREAAIADYFASVRSREQWKREQAEQRKAVTRANAALDFDGQTYLSPAAVAALCRQTLKEAFPGVRFSVTSDGSIRVRWTDGPSREQVEGFAKTFAGSYFDGMIDYKGSIFHTLDGREVRFGADFVFCERDLSVEALQQAADALAREYNTNQPAATISATSYSPKIDVNPDFPGAVPGQWAGEFNLMPPEIEGRCRHSERAALALEHWFDHLQPFTVQESPTFARLSVLGTDGYGNTAMEAADGGETGRGYPRAKPNPEGERVRDAIEQAGNEAADVLARIAAEGGLGFDVAEQRFRATTPAPAVKQADCEIIDFAPHLAAHIARADAARRIN